MDVLESVKRVKQDYLKAVVLLQNGRFFEAYNEDAMIVFACCRELNAEIKSILQDDDKVRHMIGFPCHRCGEYMALLASNGYEVITAKADEELADGYMIYEHLRKRDYPLLYDYADRKR